MDLTESEVEHLLAEIKDYQITHGSLLKLVRLEEPSTVPARPVGVSIVPTEIQRKQYLGAHALQPLFNELYVRAASDQEWMLDVFRPLLQRDAFLTALWNIHVHVQKAGVAQDMVAGIFRSDYMLHAPKVDGGSLKQVEMNTFSVAGACHAERVARMHQHLRRVGAANPRVSSDTDELPQCSNSAAIIRLLSTAHKAYARTTSHRVCVLMVVQPRNFNIADERPIEYGLWEQDVPCYRCEWQDVINHTSLTADRALLFQPQDRIPQHEVSVIYYRAGYEAAEYDTPGKTARVQLEVSRAIKCPDILTHLTTFKIVQQALGQPQAIERFLSASSAAKVRNTFMHMQVLDSSPEGERSKNLALDPQTAKDFVLKPNLEGGGHNIYREDIPQFLSELPEHEWEKYILMRLIQPPTTHGLLMMPSQIHSGPVVSELGILGTCLWRKDGMNVGFVENQVAGWTFKTKPNNVDEMSVVKGYGCFDCPALTDT